jgi:capsule polysaccharide export protein KpsE/RkpR
MLAWLFRPVIELLERILMEQAELATALNGVADELTKATAEIIAAIAASGTTTPEVDAAVAKLQGLAKALDDLNADLPTP